MVAATNGYTAPSCAMCNKNFAVNAYTDGTCVGYTTDENCNYISTSDEGCMYCFAAYYFSGATCVQSSYVIASMMASLFLLSLIYY